jgi:transcription elongation factor Elf1
MLNVQKSLYKDYELLLIKNDKLSKENRSLKYSQNLLEKQIETLRKKEELANEKLVALQKEQDDLLKEKDFEIARLKALLNMDGTNHGIPTSQTPIHKKKVIPNTREKSNKPKGGQVGHKKHKLEKFNNEEINEKIEHSMEQCPCCNSHKIEKTGEIKEKDELDYKIVVVKRRHKFVEYKCKECGKKFHEEIPNNLKEENQYGPEVQALELTLINQANVTINKAQKITYGMTNGEIDLSEGYIAKLQKRASDRLENFMEEMKVEIIKQPLLHWDDTVIMIDISGKILMYEKEKMKMYRIVQKHFVLST